MAKIVVGTSRKEGKMCWQLWLALVARRKFGLKSCLALVARRKFSLKSWLALVARRKFDLKSWLALVARKKIKIGITGGFFAGQSVGAGGNFSSFGKLGNVE